MKADIFSAELANAARLRQQMYALYGIMPSSSLIFVPGLLIGLRLLFAGLNIRKVMVSSEEYYSKNHFAGLNVSVFPLKHAVRDICKSQADVVILSVVTWRGHETEINKIFSEIRRKMGKRCPVLVADYSHAGAIGWPLVLEFNADVVCGDPSKWVVDSTKTSNLGFLWVRSMKLFRKVRLAFSPYYLALETSKITPQSRWVDASTISKLSDWYADKKIGRTALRGIFEENMAFAAMLSQRWDLGASPKTPILWLKRDPKDVLFDELKKLGLIWEINGAFRVAARADILKINRQSDWRLVFAKP